MVSHIRCFVLFLTLSVSSPELYSQQQEQPPSGDPPPAVSDAQAANRGEFEGEASGEGKELVPGINFRWCPAGSFTMGSPKSELGYYNQRYGEENQVNVKVSSGFWLGETEVTQGQWTSLMDTQPWLEQRSIHNDTLCPAVYINHDDVLTYCTKLTEQERAAGRLPPGWKYVLPTEAQWEYACRAGTKTKFSFGDSEVSLSEYGWWGGSWEILYASGNAKTEKYAHHVGTKEANPWGLKDMHGNVYEWCADRYGSKLRGGFDPVGPPFGATRVLRGGGWGSGAAGCRSAHRYSHLPVDRCSDIGFRVAGVPSIDRSMDSSKVDQ